MWLFEPMRPSDVKEGTVFLKKNLTRPLPPRELPLFFCLLPLDLCKIEVVVRRLAVGDLLACVRNPWLRIEHRAAEHAL